MLFNPSREHQRVQLTQSRRERPDLQPNAVNEGIDCFRLPAVCPGS